MKYAVACAWQNDNRTSVNITTKLCQIDADSEDEAIGAYIRLGTDEMPEHMIVHRPVLFKIEEAPQENKEESQANAQQAAGQNDDTSPDAA